MSDRDYEVSVTQAMEMIHVVRAPNKREARRIIQELTMGRLEPSDPRIIETFASGHVGHEKVSALVVRVGQLDDPRSSERESTGAGA